MAACRLGMETVGRAQLEAALAALGELLAARGAHYEVVLVGGGNLILRGLIVRPTTKDLDILGEWTPGGIAPIRPMPATLRNAVIDVGRAFGLADDWLNTGPDSLLDLGLPDGFGARLERRDFGGLVAWLAGWFDMVCFKLYAAVDQGPRSRHFQDLRDLRPGRDDLLEAARWTMSHNPSPGFRRSRGSAPQPRLDPVGRTRCRRRRRSRGRRGGSGGPHRPHCRARRR